MRKCSTPADQNSLPIPLNVYRLLSGRSYEERDLEKVVGATEPANFGVALGSHGIYRRNNAVLALRVPRFALLLLLLVACLIVGTIAFVSAPFCPVAKHMAMNAFSMNVLAPILALTVIDRRYSQMSFFGSGRVLFAACILQIAVLWTLHAPAALKLTLNEPQVHVLARGILVLVAVWFWLAILSAQGPDRWRAILALLLTGKLICLLGVLLVFSPTILYPELSILNHTHEELLLDQQFAGLLMLTACPLTYVSAGIILAARWLHELASADCRECSAGRQAI